jgi:hypothetical protein
MSRRVRREVGEKEEERKMMRRIEQKGAQQQ